jgi:quinol monooxygenase YgiN
MQVIDLAQRKPVGPCLKEVVLESRSTADDLTKIRDRVCRNFVSAYTVVLGGRELKEVLEMATVTCIPGRGDEFERAVQGALAVIAQDKQCLSAVAKRCLERPDEFVLLVGWTSVQSHIDFRQGPDFAKYRGYIAHLIAGPPNFAHYMPVGE